MPEPIPSQFEPQDFQTLESQEHQKNLEAFCERTKLREQWESQVNVLNKMRFLILLPNSHKIGIIGIDHQEYPLPSYDEIKEKITPEKLKILELKESQGFTKLLMIPMALSLETIIGQYQKLLLQKDIEKDNNQEQGNIFATDGAKLPLDRNQPVYFWEKLIGADKKPASDPDTLFYYPKNFDLNGPAIHKGKTKQQLLDENKENSWKILMVEDLPDIPAEGKGKTLPEGEKSSDKRKQLEANQSSEQYLHQLQTESQYIHEQGMIPESEIIYAITQLIEKNQVIDDYDGQGKACRLIGSLIAGKVPSFYWYRDGRRARLSWRDPGGSRSVRGVRSAVEI